MSKKLKGGTTHAWKKGINICDIHSSCSWSTLEYDNPEVYDILNSTGILDDYIIKCYDVLHTLGKEYLVEDITEFVREKGIDV